tara:strand:+ start:40 stop:816 length:777 start_codon:yes stop_codon:yes gene_type:complete
MNKDFTLVKYESLCKTIADSDYSVKKIKDFIIEKDYTSRQILIRHDVDKNIERVLRMAELERDYGLSATYYFRKKRKVFDPSLILKINNLGHDIGYHYETLDKAKGDKEKALEFFAQELREFRKILPIETCVMHGNSLSRWDNRHIWKNKRPEDYGLVGEGYLSIDFSKMYYFTDTGRRWDGHNFNVKDRMKNSISDKIKVKNTDDLIRIIENSKCNNLYLNTHPKKWSQTKIEWYKEQLDVSMRNTIKYTYKKLFGK